MHLLCHLVKKAITINTTKPQLTRRDMGLFLCLIIKKTALFSRLITFLERARGIEPPYHAWQARILTIILRPQHYYDNKNQF